MKNKTLTFSSGKTVYDIDYFIARDHAEEVIIYLHGLGSTKKDIQPIIDTKGFEDFCILAFDFPGCGNSTSNAIQKISITDLVQLLHRIAKTVSLDRFHIIGHSLGGIVGLLFAKMFSDKVLSFVNVEGNLMPEDCRVFSRYVADNFLRYPNFMQVFAQRLKLSGRISYDSFAAELAANVEPNALFSYCKDIVRHSDHFDLLNSFISLRQKKSFIYGSANADLSYISALKSKGIKIYEIPDSDHFPLYSNPVKFFDSLMDFYGRKA